MFAQNIIDEEGVKQEHVQPAAATRPKPKFTEQNRNGGKANIVVAAAPVEIDEESKKNWDQPLITARPDVEVM